MDDLITFIKARLDEDEAAARAVRQPHVWHQGDGSDPHAGWDRDMIYMWPPEYHAPVEGDKHWHGLQANDDDLAAHIARHDPDSVLREIATWRRILAEYEAGPLAGVPGFRAGFSAAFGVVLQAKASEYSDHPDWRLDGRWGRRERMQ